MILLLIFLSVSTDIRTVESWVFTRQRVSKNAKIIIERVRSSHGPYLMIQRSDEYKESSTLHGVMCNETQPIQRYTSINYINLSNLPEIIDINPGSSGGVYYFALYSCHQDITLSSIRYSFLNSWGRLIFDLYPIIYISWIESGYYLILFILCLINYFKHKDIHILIHYLILATVFISVLSSVVSGLLYFYANKVNDEDPTKSNIGERVTLIVSSVLVCFRNFFLILLPLFLSAGLSIVYEKIQTRKVVLIFIVSALFSIVGFFCNSQMFSMYFYALVLLLILYFIIAVFYFVLLCDLLGHSSKTLEAHMSLIYVNNIDPETTPTFKKLKLLAVCTSCSIAIMVVFIIAALFYFFQTIYFFISYMMNEIAMAILLSIICWNCRLRYNMVATYFDEDDDDEEDDREMNLEGGMRNTVNKDFEYQSQFQYKAKKSPDNPSDNLSSKNPNDTNSPKNANSNPDEKNLNNLNSPKNANSNELNSPNLNDSLDPDNLNRNCDQNDLNGKANGAKNEADDQNLNSEDSFSSDKDENNGNNLVKWRYGMLLPPMPKEDFSQNQVHPLD